MKNLLKFLLILTLSGQIFGNDDLNLTSPQIENNNLNLTLSQEEQKLATSDTKVASIFDIFRRKKVEKKNVIYDNKGSKTNTSNSTPVVQSPSYISFGSFSTKLQYPPAGDPRPAAIFTIEQVVNFELKRERAAAMLKYYNEAFAKHLDAISYDPNKIYALGNYYFRTRQYERAREIFQKNTDIVENLFGVAVTSRFMADYDTAIIYYSEVIDTHPNLAEPYLGRGLAYRDQEKYREALADFLKYKSMRNTEEAYAALGNIYLLRKDYSNAKFILNDGKMLYPNSKVINDLLVKAYANI